MASVDFYRSMLESVAPQTMVQPMAFPAAAPAMPPEPASPSLLAEFGVETAAPSPPMVTNMGVDYGGYMAGYDTFANSLLGPSMLSDLGAGPNANGLPKNELTGETFSSLGYDEPARQDAYLGN